MATVTACPGGLSPLARGTPPLRSSTRSISRFIPAGAGNSRSILLALFRLAVYPRWRGELCIKTSVKNFAVGLSPLARGTRTRDAPRFVGTRFIPAGAGNSHHDARATRQGSVYPRWRGELISPGISCSRGRGLSPLARGTRPSPVFRSFRPRFIPAGAGNSSRAIAIAIVRSVYPRWRGELYINEVNLWKLYGLSPLARGTLFMRGSKSPRRRFIPAGAGNSGESGCVHQWSSVYPRWRGELKQIVRFPHIHDGLSPLARGTPLFHPLML